MSIEHEMEDQEILAQASDEDTNRAMERFYRASREEYIRRALQERATDPQAANAARPPRAEVLRQAEKLTCGDRNESYGSPAANMDDTARLWSAFLGVEVTGRQVAVCMALVKIARLRTSPDHEDSHVDAAAYMAIAFECAEEMKKDA